MIRREHSIKKSAKSFSFNTTEQTKEYLNDIDKLRLKCEYIKSKSPVFLIGFGCKGLVNDTLLEIEEITIRINK